MAQKTKVKTTAAAKPKAGAKSKTARKTATSATKAAAVKPAARSKSATAKPKATTKATTKTVKQSVTSKKAAVKPKATRSASAKPAAKTAAKPAAAKAKTVKKPTAAKATAPKKAAAPAKKAAAKPATVKTASAKTAPAKVTAAKKATASSKTATSSAAVARAAATGVPQGLKAATAKSAVATKGTKLAMPTRAVAASIARTAQSKISAPVARAPSSPKDIAAKTVATRQSASAQKKPVSQRHGFKTNEYVVYPAHGVGRIIGIEEQEIAGMALELFVINFEKEKLTLRVPTGKLESVGMRKLAEENTVKKAMDILKGRARVKRTMWSRRAQEYVAKINSGDLISIAEVVRDLYRSDAQPEQSYSERQLYEDALDRMAREIAAVDKLDERGAVQRITDVLSKSARGRRLAEEGEAAAETQAA